MSDAERRIVDVALRVADGAAIDWRGEELKASDEAEARVLRGLRALQALADPGLRASSDDEETSSPDPPQAFPSGPEPPFRRLGDFELAREIGRGGMGRVYEARQISLQRRVALKILDSGLGLSRNGLRRFEREARAAAALHHTNIVPVFAIGEDLGLHFYAMELIEGASLSRVLEELGAGRPGPATRELLTTVGVESLPPAAVAAGGSDASPSSTDATTRRWFETVARLVADVADALQHAHERGIVHRDVKPANLMLSRDGRLCLTDFGLARIAEEPQLTITGTFVGTPAYMSPEQARGDSASIDHRTDIYSLGAVLYEMLTLQRPFPGVSRDRVLAAILTSEPRAPRLVNRRIPVDLETICAKAMEKDPARRYPNAGMLAADLRACTHHGLISARRAGYLRRVGKWTRRHPVATIAAAAAILIVSLGAWGVRERLGGRQALAERAFVEARFLAGQGSAAEALKHAEAAIEAAPRMTEARLLRARLLVDLHRPEEALADADRLLARAPGDWAAHLIKAVALRGRGETDSQTGASIAEHLDVVARSAPETPDAYYLRAIAEPDPGRAIALLDRALSLDPAHGEALESRIRRRIALKEFAAADLDAERLKVARPRSTIGNLMLARLRLERLDYAGALAEAETALRREPDVAENRWMRAEVLFAGSAEQARVLEDYRSASAMRPESALFHARLGRALSHYGRHAEAAEEFAAALRLDPGHGESLRGLAGELRALGRIAEARRTSLEFVERTDGWSDPRDRAGALRLAARILADCGYPDEALPLAERALTLDPSSFDGFLARARVRDALADPKGVLEDCRSAARLPVAGPDELDARITSLVEECGRGDLALPDAAEIVRRAPEWPEAWSVASLVYVVTDRADEAIATARQFGRLAPNAPAAAAALAHALGRRYRWEECAALYTRQLELDPDSAIAHLNRGGFPMRYLGRIEEGLADLDRACALLPNDDVALWARSILRAHTGRCEEADEDLLNIERRGQMNSVHFEDRAVVHAVSFWPKCRERVDLRSLLTDGEEAVRRASATHLGTAKIALGAALYRNGRFAEARDTLREAMTLVVKRLNSIEDVQDENYGRFMLAMAAARLGRLSEARDEYRRALEWSRTTHREADPDIVALRAEAEALLGPGT